MHVKNEGYVCGFYGGFGGTTGGFGDGGFDAGFGKAGPTFDGGNDGTNKLLSIISTRLASSTASRALITSAGTTSRTRDSIVEGGVWNPSSKTQS